MVGDLKGAWTDYRVFGGILRSELTLPALPACESGGREPADWTLRVRSLPAVELPDRPLAEDGVEPGVRVRLHWPGTGTGAYLLDYDDTGLFHISGDGSRIDWFAREGAKVEDVRLDVLGRVLPLALHLNGFFVLHASAVLWDRRAIVVAGPKGHGKSTLALALVERGGVLLTDDALPIQLASVPMARAGVRGIRLRRDVAEAATLPARGVRRRGARTEIDFGRDERIAGDQLPVPIAGIYLLDPRPPGGDGRAVRSERLDGPRAAVALMSQAKLAPLLQPWAGRRLLQAAASIARRVPVRRLEVVRDLSRVDEVARFLLEVDSDVPEVGSEVPEMGTGVSRDRVAAG